MEKSREIYENLMAEDEVAEEVTEEEAIEESDEEQVEEATEEVEESIVDEMRATLAAQAVLTPLEKLS